ncbi:uncharacterized protein F5147DRAFT_660651 [Suillus discolor]|uniref:Uncharacterized protein n=1 Tax=Suillus discolor TaxID=1912936 RepID=A0A9P7EQZ9_9AGAM|nr:uncharacterized protein F5147DRAFT_660651 [Suillus discolor]KAG2081947.1 hypothetical protein F5147DRAFT_660651 [Suillus discolor]
MCFSAYKRAADTALTPTKASKRMRIRLESAGRSSDDKEKELNDLGSASQERTIKEYAYTLLEMLERLEYDVENSEADWFRDKKEFEETHIRHLQEIEELRMMHHDELEQYQDRIDELEEDVRYKQDIIDVLTNDVSRLEEENDRHRTDIDRMIEHSVQDGIARRVSFSALKDTVIACFDKADLDSRT